MKPVLLHHADDALRSLARGLFCVAVLVVAGLASRPLVAPAWSEIRSNTPELSQAALQDALGQGILIGVFGGFRTFLADMTWLRMTFFWARNDSAKTQAAIHFATTLDPRPFYFWSSGARIMAYDVPRWRIRDEHERAGGMTRDNLWRAIRNEQALKAILFLERAERFHPDEPWVWIEIAQIYVHQLNDIRTAADYFGRAAAMPDAPYFAGRLHAELLRRAGDPARAYRYYREWYPTLPADDRYAMPGLVLERIRALEEELGIPEAERLPAANP